MRGHKDIHDDAEDKCTGDGGNCDLTEGKCHTADAGNENNSDDEEVFVFAEVNVLNHLETTLPIRFLPTRNMKPNIANRLTARDICDISSTQSREPQEIHWAEFLLQE